VFPTCCAETVYEAAEAAGPDDDGADDDGADDDGAFVPAVPAECVDDPHAAPTTARPATPIKPRFNPRILWGFVLFMT
jgi:hypothetical protein